MKVDCIGWNIDRKVGWNIEQWLLKHGLKQRSLKHWFETLAGTLEESLKIFKNITTIFIYLYGLVKQSNCWFPSAWEFTKQDTCRGNWIQSLTGLDNIRSIDIRAVLYPCEYGVTVQLDAMKLSSTACRCLWNARHLDICESCESTKQNREVPLVWSSHRPRPTVYWSRLASDSLLPRTASLELSPTDTNPWNDI